MSTQNSCVAVHCPPQEQRSAIASSLALLQLLASAGLEAAASISTSPPLLLGAGTSPAGPLPPRPPRSFWLHFCHRSTRVVPVVPVMQGKAAIAVTSRVSKPQGEQPGTPCWRCCLPPGVGQEQKPRRLREGGRRHWGGGSQTAANRG